MTRLIIILLVATTLTSCFSTKFVSSTSPIRVLQKIPEKSKLIIYMDNSTTIPGKLKGINDSYVFVKRIFKELESIPLKRIIGVKTIGIEAFLAPNQIINYLNSETKIVVRTWDSQEYKGILIDKNENDILIDRKISGEELLIIPMASINSITARFNQAQIIQSKSQITSLLHRLKSVDRIRVREFNGLSIVGKVKSMSHNQIKFRDGSIINIDEIATIEQRELEVDKSATLILIALGLAF